MSLKNSQDIFERVKEIIAEQLEIDEENITYDSSLHEDLDADSLDAVDIIMTLEDEYGIEILEEDAEHFQTVADIVKYIEDNQ